MMWKAPIATLMGALAFAAPSPAGEGALRVRASEAAAPCLKAALGVSSAFRRGTDVQVGDILDENGADVLVASSVEITRALETGLADPDTDADLASIPWVLAGSAAPAGGVAELAGTDQTVSVPAGPAAYEARRALELVVPGRVREVAGHELRSAPVAIVPQSLGGAGHKVLDGIPPLLVRAAVSMRAGRKEAARSLLRYLTSPNGRRAFGGCVPPP